MIEDKNPQRTPLSELGEFKLIEHLTEHVKVTQKSTVKSIGDDAAVLDHGKKQIVVTTDLLIEGVHFDLSYVPLKHLGYKAVIVNLSDVYAILRASFHEVCVQDHPEKSIRRLRAHRANQ